MTDQNDQTGTPDEPQQDDLPTATDDGTEALPDARPVAADEDYAEIYAGEDAGADDEAAVDEGEGGDDDLSAEEPGDDADRGQNRKHPVHVALPRLSARPRPTLREPPRSA